MNNQPDPHGHTPLTHSTTIASVFSTADLQAFSADFSDTITIDRKALLDLRSGTMHNIKRAQELLDKINLALGIDEQK